MPMSPEALVGLRAAVTWNPHGAAELLAILRESPGWVKRKDDPYGPIHAIFAIPPRRWLTGEISVPIVPPPPFPSEWLPACRVFGDEWRQRSFTKRELADAIEQLLEEDEAHRST